MKLKFGDIIQFYFASDTCWGPKGNHTGIVLYDENRNLVVNHLDKKLIDFRFEGLVIPQYDVLDADFFNQCNEIVLLGNIAYKGIRL